MPSISNRKVTLLLVSFCLIIILQLGTAIGETKIDCAAKCQFRCSKASRHKMCIRACNTCCQRCSCVPPGTYGNYEACPCYARMTTHGGRKKCP